MTELHRGAQRLNMLHIMIEHPLREISRFKATREWSVHSRENASSPFFAAPKIERMAWTTLPSVWTILFILCCVQCGNHHNGASAFNFPTTINGKTNRPYSTALGVASEAQVVKAAKRVMSNSGYFAPIDASLYADDFIFRGPVIGPLNKNDYQDVLNYFSIYKAFPDIDPNCFGFTVDPENPLRVWYFVRATGTYQQPIGGPLGNFIRPNNEVYRGSPETWSLTFDDNLKARLMTAGYVSDRFDASHTTDGAGLSFGILKTLGVSLFSGPGDPRLRFIQAINGPLVQLGIAPKAVSAPDEIPAWWTNSKRGADN